MKKIFRIFIILLAILWQNTVFAEQFKITSVNYDTSGAIMFLTSPDNTSEPIAKEIKLIKLSNPNRAYFDINSAILTCEKQDYQFSSGKVKRVIVSQNSVNPDIVRVVLYFDDNFNPSKINLFKLNNNIVVKINDIGNESDYFQNTYRDERTSVHDFYEYLSISSQNINKVETPVKQQTSDKVLNQIQQAFNNSTIPVNIKSIYENADVNVIKKELKLNTGYYLNGVHKKNNGVLLSGFGEVTVERPMFLTSPNRVVFDLPNTLVNPSLRNKEYRINDKETIKVGQFEANKARIVVTSDDTEKYLPVYSADNQTLLIADKYTLKHDELTLIRTNMVTYNYKKGDDDTNEFVIRFTKPVVHCVKRDNSNLVVYLFNVEQYNELDFKNSIKSTDMSALKSELMPKCGVRLTLPADTNDIVKVYLGSDAKTIKITLKTAKKQFTPVFKKKNSGERSVVIDPGHGGVDYGAIRAGINEKDITLDVSERIAAILKSKGYKVTMTRNIDETLSLQGRVDIAENAAPDIFVSVHVNSSVKDDISGLETHYYHDYSIGLAQAIHSAIVSNIKSKDRGLFKSKFYVINHTTMPAILVEIGFISNATERAALVTEQRKQQTAKAIAEGIINYFKTQQK